MAILSVGWLHPDEHFQILEFAGFKLNLTQKENLPWEFQYRMRSSVQPFMVVLTHKIAGFFGTQNPFSIASFLRILSAAISFLGMWLMYRVYSREIRNDILQKWFLYLSFLLWFAIYNYVRFSSETWSGSIFIIAYSYFLARQPEKTKLYFLVTGLLLGFSFLFRYQTGLLITGLFCWCVFIRKERSVNLLLMSLGIIMPILIGVIIDRWFYGVWTFTSWNYFHQNILLDKVSGFGVEPWYFYFEDVFIRAIPPFSLVYILSFLIVFIYRRKDSLTWIILPYLLFHFLVGHKETRFLFPLIGFIPIIVIKAIEATSYKLGKDITENAFIHSFAKVFWIFNLIFLLLCAFNPADNQIYLFKKIYTEYSSSATLYYKEENPYHRALDISYYKRANLAIKRVASWDQLTNDPPGIKLIVTRKKDPVDPFTMNKKLIYSSYPEWIRKFNINNWVDRTNIWIVYEVPDSTK